MKNLPSNPSTSPSDLPNPKIFVLFIGYPRSGHSLMGALINAHPQAIVSHELDVLALVHQGNSRTEILSKIIARDQWFEKQNRQWEGYQYSIKPFNPSQNLPITTPIPPPITMMGDKKGAGTSTWYAKDPALLSRLIDLMDCQIRIIHYIRNPFDTIATMTQKGPHPYNKQLDGSIQFYTELHNINAAIQSAYPNDTHTIHHEHLIKSPSQTLSEAFEFLGHGISPANAATLSESIFSTPSQSRFDIPWAPSHIKQVTTLINQSPLLTPYKHSTLPKTR